VSAGCAVLAGLMGCFYRRVVLDLKEADRRQDAIGGIEKSLLALSVQKLGREVQRNDRGEGESVSG